MMPVRMESETCAQRSVQRRQTRQALMQAAAVLFPHSSSLSFVCLCRLLQSNCCREGLTCAGSPVSTCVIEVQDSQPVQECTDNSTLPTPLLPGEFTQCNNTVLCTQWTESDLICLANLCMRRTNDTDVPEGFANQCDAVRSSDNNTRERERLPPTACDCQLTRATAQLFRVLLSASPRTTAVCPI